MSISVRFLSSVTVYAVTFWGVIPPNIGSHRFAATCRLHEEQIPLSDSFPSKTEAANSYQTARCHKLAGRDLKVRPQRSYCDRIQAM